MTTRSPADGLPPVLRFLDSCVSWYATGTMPPAEPPGSTAGWRITIDQARKHGLGPLLGYMIKRGVPGIGRPAASAAAELIRDYRASTARNILLSGQLQEQLGLLASHGIGAVVVKGGALTDTVYGDNPGIRPVADADIVVPGHDFQRAAALLAATGARRRDVRPPHHQLMVWDRRDMVPIDLHGSFFQTRLPLSVLGYRLPEKEFSAFAAAGRPLASPAHVFFLVYHAVQHGLRRLIWWLDIVLVLRSMPARARADLESLLTRTGARGVVSTVLWLIDKRLAAALPEGRGTCLPGRLLWPGRLALARIGAGRYPPQLNLALYPACAPEAAGIPRFILAALAPEAKALEGTYPGKSRREQWRSHLRRLLSVLRGWLT